MSFKHLQLLGWPCLVTAQGAQALPASRPMQLLACLAVTGAWQGRDAMARLFWPLSPDKLARSNLRNLLFKTGQAAPWAPLEATEHALRLVVPTDLQRLAAAVQQADWDAVVQLGAEALLQGFEQQASEPWLRWLHDEREALLASWKTAAQALLAQPGRPVEQREALAAAWARRCPDDEDAVIARIALARERGQGAAAERLYRDFEAGLQQAFGVRPSRALERVALQDAPEAAAPAGAQARPVAPTAPARAASAASRPALFGRRLELARLTSLLADASVRLVCLTGPGGVGKSTLLAAMLAQAQEAGHVHARLLDAGAAPSAAAVIAALGRLLGVEDLPGADAAAALAAAVGDMECLVLLDGAEQAGLAGPVALLLDRCPRLRLVVASRVRLHIDQELVVPLEGFPLPDAEETDADVLSSNDAVRYLAAVMRQAGQAVDPAREAPAMALLARAVEGLPLALKLLARLTRLYTLQQLLQSLRVDGAGLAGTDSPALGELMPALVASFDRSWSALAPQQQAALARLAVFPSPFDVAAARAVGRASLPVIASLVDASLLRSDGAGRLSLHAAIRACVRAVVDLPAQTEDDFLEHYRQRLAALAALARTRTVRPLREFLRNDAGQVDRAWQLALQRRAYPALQSMAESLWFMVDTVSGNDGWYAGYAASGSLLREDPGTPQALRALLTADAARLAYSNGQLEQAEPLARAALRLAQRVRHHEAMVSALDMLIRVCLVQGRQREARALMPRMEALLDPDRDDGLLTALVLKLRQMMAIVDAHAAPDLRNADRLEALYERFDDADALVRVLLAKANAHASAGDLPRGIAGMERAAEVAGQRDAHPALRAAALCDAAGWLIELGRLDRARVLAERAAAVSYALPQAHFLRVRTRLVQAELAVAAGQAAPAAPLLAEVLAAMGRGEELPMAGTVFLVAARWFLLLPQRDAAVALLRAVPRLVWEMNVYEAAQALLAELGEPPAPDAGDAVPGPLASDVASEARRRVLQWLEEAPGRPPPR